MKFKFLVLCSIMVFIEYSYSMGKNSSIGGSDKSGDGLKVCQNINSDQSDLSKWQGEKLVDEGGAKVKANLGDYVLSMELWKDTVLQTLMNQLVMEQEKTRRAEAEIDRLRSRIEKIEISDQEKMEQISAIRQMLEQQIVPENVNGIYYNEQFSFNLGVETNSRQGKIDTVQRDLKLAREQIGEERDIHELPSINFSLSYKVLEGPSCPVFRRKLRHYQLYEQIEWIMNAIQRGDILAVEKRILSGMDINSRTKDGRTPLYMAAKLNRLDIVEWLIDHGAFVELQSNKKFTALHVAAMNGHLEVVQELIFSGANAEAVTDMGATPLWLASYNGHLDVVKWFASRYVNVNVIAKGGFTPLHIAAQNGYLDLVTWLATNGANVFSCTEYGDTALHIAVENKNLEVVRYLASEFELLYIVNRRGKTALQLAKERDYGEIVDILEKFMVAEKYTNTFS